MCSHASRNAHHSAVREAGMWAARFKRLHHTHLRSDKGVRD